MKAGSEIKQYVVIFENGIKVSDWISGLHFGKS